MARGLSPVTSTSTGCAQKPVEIRSQVEFVCEWKPPGGGYIIAGFLRDLVKEKSLSDSCEFHPPSGPEGLEPMRGGEKLTYSQPPVQFSPHSFSFSHPPLHTRTHSLLTHFLKGFIFHVISSGVALPT